MYVRNLRSLYVQEKVYTASYNTKINSVKKLFPEPKKHLAIIVRMRQ